METNIDGFPGRLKEAIGANSMRAFGIKCGLSEGALRKYLAGKSEPGMAALVAIAQEAKVRLDWLITGAGPKQPAMEGQGTGQNSLPPVDREIMETTIEIVEEVFEEHDLVLAPAKKAKLIMLLHDMFLEDQAKIKGAKNTIIELIKFAS